MGLQSADTDYTISCIQSTEHGKVRASSFDVIYTPEKSGIYAITVFCGNIPLNGGHPFKKEVSAGTFKMSCFFFLRKMPIPRATCVAVSFELFLTSLEPYQLFVFSKGK